MGLFDSIIGSATGAAGADHPGLLDAVTSLVNNRDSGGLAGLVETFRQKGLGDAVASWISTGHNLPVSAEQMQVVLGNGQLQAIAQKLGLSLPDAAQALAHALPQVIDRLTPNGQLPEGDLLEQGLSILRGFASKP